MHKKLSERDGIAQLVAYIALGLSCRTSQNTWNWLILGSGVGFVNFMLVSLRMQMHRPFMRCIKLF